jgi:hypothetical protein
MAPWSKVSCDVREALSTPQMYIQAARLVNICFALKRGGSMGIRLAHRRCSAELDRVRKLPSEVCCPLGYFIGEALGRDLMEMIL